MANCYIVITRLGKIFQRLTATLDYLRPPMVASPINGILLEWPPSATWPTTCVPSTSAMSRSSSACQQDMCASHRGKFIGNNKMCLQQLLWTFVETKQNKGSTRFYVDLHRYDMRFFVTRSVTTGVFLNPCGQAQLSNIRFRQLISPAQNKN